MQSEKKLKLFSIFLFYFCDIFPYLFFILFKRKKITFFYGFIFLFLILFKKPNTLKKLLKWLNILKIEFDLIPISILFNYQNLWNIPTQIHGYSYDLKTMIFH